MSESKVDHAASAPLAYAGIYTVAASTLMLELLFTRITSVVAWYHLAFFVISLGMLGMSAGAVYVYVRRDHFPDAKIAERVATSALRFALLTPVVSCLALASPLQPVRGLMDAFGLLLYASLLALPFFEAGVVLTLMLTRSRLPPSRSYGVDLLGAASGCALVIPLLAIVDAPSGVLVASALGAVGAACFAIAAGKSPRSALIASVTLLCLAAGNVALQTPLRPAWVKGEYERIDRLESVEWNSFSRISVSKPMQRPPAFWALSLKAPVEVIAPIEQRELLIDGSAGTALATMGKGPEAHRYLLYDLSAFAHHLRPTGPAAVIGVGGGRDVLAAKIAGHEEIVGVELNELIVALHRGRLADVSGIAALPGVEIVNDEARSWFTRERRQFDVITMSLIDTWASTGAGAYSLSENGLYTVEAFRTFMRRLTPTGVFSVSRWYHPQSPGESARLLSLAMDSVWSFDVKDPRKHILMVQWGPIATLLVSPRPWSAKDIDLAQETAKRYGYNLIASPRRAPSHPLLKGVWEQPDRQALWAYCSNQELDLTPPTDDRPYFFNMLKPQTLWARGLGAEELDVSFLGNLQATTTLLTATGVSFALTLLTCMVPLALRRRESVELGAHELAALGYFAAIGLGFMFVEMALLSRLGVFLGHPMLALAVLLAGMIAFTGLGSMLSGLLTLRSPLAARLYPLIPAALVITSALTLEAVLSGFGSAATPVRVLVATASVAVPALGMGLCFPLGLRLSRTGAGDSAPLGPWLWAVNGACGVLASGVGLLISMMMGVLTTMLIGAACYLFLLLCTAIMARRSDADPAGRDVDAVGHSS